MPTLHLVLGTLVVAINAAAGIWGVWCWFKFHPSVFFWRILRTGQVVLIVQVLLGGLLLLMNYEPRDEIHILYGLLPVAVMFIAEQVRIASADAVLTARDLDSTDDVRSLPEDEQHSVVLAIVRREIGVMAISALVIAALALRAADTSGSLGF